MAHIPASRAQASRPPKDRADAGSQARGKQFSDQPKYFIAEVTNPASLTLQFCDGEAALQSGTSHPTGGMLKMLNTILLVIMLTVLGETATTIEPCDGSFNDPALG